jgi:integrase
VADPILSTKDIKAQVAFHRAELDRLEKLLHPSTGRGPINKLSAAKVANLRQRRLHSDGSGLYLDLRHLPARSWAFRYVIDGQRREMGLGPLSRVSLAEARAKRDAARQLVKAGTDPIEQRRAERAARLVPTVKPITFASCAAAYIEAHEASWRSAKNRVQFRTGLEKHAAAIAAMAVKDIDTPDILAVIEPLWSTKTKTASVLRQRIEAILDWAKVRGHRSGENPARWRGHLDHLLPSPEKVAPVVHFRAMPYGAVPGFMAELADKGSLSAMSLAFTILTAGRVSEMRFATWEECDTTNRLWTIPASRMKAGRAHRSPLSAAALAILDQMRELPRNPQGRVFPIGESAVLRHAQAAGCTTHGFRSAFRDWCAERTRFPAEVAELALAHQVGSATEMAYRRTDLFERRRKLAEQWAQFVTSPAPAETVVPLRA